MSTTVELVRANERYARLRAAIEEIAGEYDEIWVSRIPSYVEGWEVASDLRALLAVVDS